MSSFNPNPDYGFGLDYLVDDLNDYQQSRGTGRSYQSYDPFTYPLYQTPTQLSNSHHNHNPTSISQTHSIQSTSYHSQLSTHSIPSTAYSDAYNLNSNHQTGWNIPNSNPNPSRLQSTSNLYIGSPSLSPPNHQILDQRFERNPSSPTIHSNHHPNQTPRITNQIRSNSINRGGSGRRFAPANKICETCGLGFTRNERLRYHVERVHLQVEPDHACELEGCNRAFRQRSDLLRHQRTVHSSQS
ncbi:uncharacterized protein MELLADRAFT_61177 [Melampsora larici-populina 98AG31]|uniref:C2H2-type domain-containing protein n=1 Tax=Melampsora larici-populina (strain 98AG31 / pathotype 3-4-7) TaxID=747676 RepID=F4RDW4_MELLP|nr:uncharacterized protein MELLADRAFT_61177 [Melampsora larici-populina 98AG31]EGG09475.1 hypothetical protein MELLADRAFT_61177 [Melampsora larici-populina 98AG31]